MTRLLRALLAPLTLALGLPVAILAAPAVALAGDPCYHDFAMPARTVSTSPAVTALDCAFAPTVTRVPVGTTVTWTNRDDVPHTVTSSTKVFKSPPLDTGETFTYTFKQAGTFEYYCALHPHMTGKVVVK